jgi:small GTP-binding protein
MMDFSKKPFKVLLLGDSGVGKSCLMERLVDGHFYDHYVSTIGVDFKLKKLRLRDDSTVTLQLWDTAGQERFRAITTIYYKDADAVVVVYNVEDLRSFNNVTNWLQSVTKRVSGVCCMLVGSKCDVEKRSVERAQGEALARSHDAIFFECSSKTGQNVETAFSALAERLHERRLANLTVEEEQPRTLISSADAERSAISQRSNDDVECKC